MTLYHFTAKRYLDGILKEGITRGFIPCDVHGKLVLAPGFIWLTSDGDFGHQGLWNTQGIVDFSRTDFRLTVKIPKTSRMHLRHVSTLRIPGPIKLYGEAYDWNHWWVFGSRIPPAWIRRVTHEKPVQQNDRHRLPPGMDVSVRGTAGDAVRES